MAKNKRRKYLIGVDVGGTKILAAVMDPHCRVKAVCKVPVDAHRGAAVFLDQIVKTVQEAVDEAGLKWKHVAALGMGCPGMIEQPQGIVRLSPNLSFLKNYPLRKKLMQRLKIPVTIENDVNAGLYGEFHFGAARGCQNAVGIFWGTGVGGGLILDGKIYRGSTGAAGEIGHTFVNAPALTDISDRSGTLESQIGRLALSADAGLLVLKQQAKVLYEKAGTDLRKMKSKTLLRSIRGGDQAVKELMRCKARVLGIAMANAVNLLNPERIVLGGGVMEAMGSILLPVAKKTMREYALAPVVRNVSVELARLGDYAIAMGAAQLAYEALQKGRHGAG